MSDAGNDTKTYVSTSEAAQMLDVSQRTVQLWVERGWLEAWKTVGGHRRITRNSIEQLRLHRLAKQGSFRVLVVEDEPVQRALYRKYLEQMKLPLEVHTAEDGFKGLLKLGELKPRLLLIDLVMPGMDGLQMLQALRESDPSESTEVLLMTALDREGVEAMGDEVKGLRVLYKPFSYSELEAAVRDALTGVGLLPMQLNR